MRGQLPRPAPLASGGDPWNFPAGIWAWICVIRWSHRRRRWPAAWTGFRRLADAGLAAVVLPSLFEEELRREAAQNVAAWETGIDSFGEPLSYFPDIDGLDPNPRRYLSLIERAVA